MLNGSDVVAGSLGRDLRHPLSYRRHRPLAADHGRPSPRGHASSCNVLPRSRRHPSPPSTRTFWGAKVGLTASHREGGFMTAGAKRRRERSHPPEPESPSSKPCLEAARREGREKGPRRRSGLGRRDAAEDRPADLRLAPCEADQKIVRHTDASKTRCNVMRHRAVLRLNRRRRPQSSQAVYGLRQADPAFETNSMAASSGPPRGGPFCVREREPLHDPESGTGGGLATEELCGRARRSRRQTATNPAHRSPTQQATGLRAT